MSEIRRAVIIDGNAEPLIAKGGDEFAKRALGPRLLFRDLADDPARIDAGLIQHEAHMAQGIIDRFAHAKNREGSKLTKTEACGSRNMPAFSRCSVRVNVSTSKRLSPVSPPKNTAGFTGWPSRNGLIKPS